MGCAHFRLNSSVPLLDMQMEVGPIGARSRDMTNGVRCRGVGRKAASWTRKRSVGNSKQMRVCSTEKAAAGEKLDDKVNIPVGEKVQDSRETVWQQLLELLGHTAGDNGHWNYSPEWWGTQGPGGWGQSEGQVVFEGHSKLNGTIQVTAHAASKGGFESDSLAVNRDEVSSDIALREEWRVLRFNTITRQSVNRVTILSEDEPASAPEHQQQREWLQPRMAMDLHPECLPPEYLKTVASVFAALVGLIQMVNEVIPSVVESNEQEGGSLENKRLRVLCIGVGGGTLPMFLLHHYRSAHVDAVEIDPMVIEAARSAMGFPEEGQHDRLDVHIIDACDFVKKRVAEDKSQFYDVVYVDAFDGDDDVPDGLCSKEFAENVARILHPRTGAFVMNFHDGDIQDKFDVFSDAVGRNTPDRESASFYVSCQKQKNLVLCCARSPVFRQIETRARLIDVIRSTASFVSQDVGYNFPAGMRVVKDFQFIS
eukprot:jgi/Picsp_1/5913/NSC_03270-R1_s-adenosylmethionine-dependent methyltransferase domain-containing protein